MQPQRSSLIILILLGLALSGCTLFDLNEEDRPLMPEEIKSLKAEADSLRRQGRILREKSEFAEALELQTRALELSRQTDDTISIIQDLNQLATTFRRLGRMEQAVNYHYQALSYAEVCSDTSEVARKNLVVSLNGLGNAHMSLGYDRLAEECFRRALIGEIEIESHLGMAINYANLGSIYNRKEQLDTARWYYEKSMAENQLIQSTMGMSLCHVYYGRLFEKQDSLLAAEQEYRKAAELMDGNEDRYHAIEPLLALGSNLLRQGRLNEATQYAEKVDSLAAEMHSFQYLQEASELQASIFEAKGNSKEALIAFKQSVAWQDSTNNRDKDHTIRDICIRYEQRHTQREMDKLQQAYDKNTEMHNIIFWVELGMLIFALIIVALLWYASDSRKSRIEALNKLDSMRNTFFRNITHEFRTPLTVILGLSEQLKDENLATSQRKHFISSIQQQGKTLLDLVNQLLSYSKLMAGCGQCNWCHGDVIAFIRLKMASYADFARIRNIELKFVSDQDKVEMDFSPEYYDKIINNLLGNAFKFTASGGSITVKASMREDHFVLDFIDTGTGISPEDKEHIFDQFYQGHNSRMEGSTGIGLPYVQQMVHHMGGIISAKDNLPHGTDIQIILSPRCNEEGADIKPWTLQDSLTAQLSPTTTGNTLTSESESVDYVNEQEDETLPLLMIVEDNPDVAEYIGVLLRTHYRVIKACDGYDAINKATKSLPDIIITDRMMPGMDGYQLCHSIRQLQLLSDVPIIIVSALSEDKERKRGTEDCADGYLLKPFNPNELMTLLSRLLKQRQERRVVIRNIIDGETPTLQNNENDSETPISQNNENNADTEGINVVEFLERLRKVVEKQMSEGDTQIDLISEQMKMSRTMLSRQIRQIAGCSPSTYILQIRMKYAQELLIDSKLTLGEVALMCGFDDISYFSRVFRQNFDQTPSQFRASLDKVKN